MTITASESMAEDRQKTGPDDLDDSGERGRRQRRKNIALGVLLAAFALLVYFVAIVRMGAGG